MVLDNWYWSRFNNIKDYQKTVIALNTGMSNTGFTQELRTIQMNLGRRQGASTAIMQFIKEHVDLNIVLIVPNQSILNWFKTDLGISNSNKLKLYSAEDIKNIIFESHIDIIFIDVATYIKDKLFLENSLSALNSLSNKNQWVIKFG